MWQTDRRSDFVPAHCGSLTNRVASVGRKIKCSDDLKRAAATIKVMLTIDLHH